MAARSLFDRKFGEDLLERVPQQPGVYRYLGEDNEVLYVGKAKNLRRRLSNYKNASRKKVHRKMRRLVQAASSVSFEICATEQAALLLESELIRTLKPPFNVDGAFSFLYPFLGLGSWDKHLILCFTTKADAFEALSLEWYGCFRSRPRVKEAFEALIDLLGLLGHREKSARLPEHPRIRGSRLVGFRQLPPLITEQLPSFLSGESSEFVPTTARLLLSKPRALKEPAEIQLKLKLLQHFYEVDTERLRLTLLAANSTATNISQDARDALFIQASGDASQG